MRRRKFDGEFQMEVATRYCHLQDAGAQFPLAVIAEEFNIRYAIAYRLAMLGLARLNRIMVERPSAYARAIKYEINWLPIDFDESQRYHWSLYVEYRGPHQWAVCDGFRSCYSKNGEWDFEMNPSERVDEWKVEHRYTLDQALELAEKLARTYTVNGKTYEDAIRLAKSWAQDG